MIGRTIPLYETSAKLGTGGVGEVYLDGVALPHR
jgi:hypothetical protein